MTTEAKPIHDQEQAASIEAVNDERPDEAAPSAKDAVNRVQGAAATDNKDDPVSPSSLPRATESKTRLRSSIDAERDSKSDRSPPNRAASLRPANLSRMLDLDLRLRSDDNSTVDEAREEMARDKVDETQIKLARGAVDPDPDVRRELVEALSYIDVVDTRSWLLYLSHDQDAKVRLAVIARIASSEHAEFKKRLAELADGDGDERVRRQARVAVESNKER